eukprot:SAG31_NODE_9496_length_1268_cov_1.100941_1_plen_53_part_10
MPRMQATKGSLFVAQDLVDVVRPVRVLHERVPMRGIHFRDACIPPQHDAYVPV